MQFFGFEDYRLAGRRLAAELAIPYQEVNVHRFPDGEHRLTLPLPVSETVLVCRSLFEPNSKLVDLLLLSETARRQGTKRLVLVAPYLCYMRQDKAFHPGEAISQYIIGRHLADMFDIVITVDPHMHRTPSLADAVPAKQAITLSATRPLADHLATSGRDWLLAGPDEESEQWVKSIAELCGLPYIIGRKERRGDREVSIRFPDMDIKQRPVALIDDVISTGRTLAESARYLLNGGAEEVQCFATHLLPHAGAAATLCEAGVSRVNSTDSIESAGETIHLASLLAGAIRQHL
jgi:ribose-phosphate pyrophosphokinase